MASSLHQRSSGKGASAAAAPAPAAAAADDNGPPKARLRGAIHHYAVFVAAAVGILLVLDAQSPTARWGCIVYTLSTTAMFGTSAMYHRPSWGPKARQVMRRLDHAAIFLLIAGTNTPLALLALDSTQAGGCLAGWHAAAGQGLGGQQCRSFRLLALVWGGALAGIAQCLFFSHAPKAVAATLYVALGWAVLPFARQYHDALEGLDVGLIVAGGVIYSLGAVVYALKWPDPVPHVFGYHEVFHCFVTLAALLHFAAVYRVVNSPPLMRGTLSALSHSANSAALLTPHGSSP
ncbi:hypothetical protein CHLNCDRAFT_36267 [Chlorella variabilis]|uniref:Hemolysin III n=1 Tax=Chlorella variabilis TaxID=554065 RepID=E1ZJX3_CHLVA|nr:hypothetical protein CHLNCDRAFT_36267 [Chlorella variabilis]EFN54069.1 hypothetical protein CHLNCDRAFT_36267 [Chlorella variabilis]|eukprot:XP_005846171.1 hypothetical protein CHLNCDRAFT_36267 [Chlorella variabilis]